MPFQIRWLIKGFLTMITAEGFLPCMDSHVIVQITFWNIDLIADTTAEGFLPCMGSHVPDQSWSITKGLLAMITTVGVLPCMNSHVLDQLGSITEGRFADTKAEWFLPWMYSHMLDQWCFRTEGLLEVIKFVGFLPCMYAICSARCIAVFPEQKTLTILGTVTLRKNYQISNKKHQHSKQVTVTFSKFSVADPDSNRRLDSDPN